MRERGFMVRCGVVRLDNKAKAELEVVKRWFPPDPGTPSWRSFRPPNQL